MHFFYCSTHLNYAQFRLAQTRYDVRRFGERKLRVTGYRLQVTSSLYCQANVQPVTCNCQLSTFNSNVGESERRLVGDSSGESLPEVGGGFRSVDIVRRGAIHDAG